MTHAPPASNGRHDTLPDVTGRSGRGTARQTVRVDEALWKRFGDLAPGGNRSEFNRSEVVRDFIRWYVRDTGARMPKRPAEATPEQGS